MKKLVIIGGGHAHVEVLRRFGLDRLAGVDVTLVSPDRNTPYSGMLPGLLAGHYTFAQCHIDLQALAHFAGASLRLARARALDPVRRVVTLEDGSTLDYDVATLDVGSVPSAQDIEGVATHAIVVKPVRGMLAAWETLQARVQGVGSAVRSIAVVGGGAAGVEVLLAMQHRLAQLKARTLPEYHLITDTPQLLPQHAGCARALIERSLARKRVHVHRGWRVTRVEADALIARDAAQQVLRIGADAVVWVTGAAPPHWLEHSGLALNDKRFLAVNANLQSLNYGNVFAAGDCASVAGATYPKSGVYAVRQGPPLTANLRAALQNVEHKFQSYVPQNRALALISTGERRAIASWGALALHGNWVWRWKDQIDQAFMRKYQDLIVG